jgi:hypothetical protein
MQNNRANTILQALNSRLRDFSTLAFQSDLSQLAYIGLPLLKFTSFVLSIFRVSSVYHICIIRMYTEDIHKIY